MICWSCQRNAGPAGTPDISDVTCGACGAIQPPNPNTDHFAVLGVERRYDVDRADLERRYRLLSRQLHPDRYARADPQARRASLGRSVQLNEAWRTLKDPIRRAEYLLSLHGVELAKGEGMGGAKVAPELLAEILELRSELGEARLDGDDAKVQTMAAAMRSRSEAALAQVRSALDHPEQEGEGALAAAARALVALRYYGRFLDEVAAHDEARQDAAQMKDGETEGEPPYVRA